MGMFNARNFFCSRMAERRPSVVFVQQPVSRVISGSSATFSVSVQTVPAGLPVTYQWYRLARGQGFAVAMPGETAATLNLVGLSQGNNDGDFYRVEVRPAESTLTRPVSYSSAAASLHFVGSSILSGVYACGYGSGDNSNALGDVGQSDRNWLVRILDGGVSRVSMGSRHGFVIKNNGELWGWGHNNWYVGTGEAGANVEISVPTRIGSGTWSEVSAGGDHTLAIKSDGTLWGWGGSGANDGRAPFAGVPTLIDSGSWSKVSAGGRGYSSTSQSFGHSMAIKSDGTLWAWGNNTYGQLGLGDVNNRSVLTQVAPGTGWAWKDVSAGYLSTMAIREDGKLWGWGADNIMADLGGGQFSVDTIVVNTPVQLDQGSSWSEISVGASWSVGIKSNGTLWSAFGLGSNSGIWQSLGHSADRWSQVAAGFNSRYAIRNDGTLWSWGSQERGELSNAELTGEYWPRENQLEGYDYGLLDVEQPTMIDSGVWGKLSAGDFNFLAAR